MDKFFIDIYDKDEPFQPLIFFVLVENPKDVSIAIEKAQKVDGYTTEDLEKELKLIKNIKILYNPNKSQIVRLGF